MDITRRAFWPTALALTLPLSRDTASQSTMSDIFFSIGSVSDAKSVVSHFMGLDFRGLLAVFNEFYPAFKDQDMPCIDVLKTEIERVRKQYRHNIRRLDALPAVLAVHNLTRTIGREALFSEIIQCLRNHPAAREIVLRNLISVTRPTFDSVRLPPVSSDLLSAIRSITQESFSNKDLFHDIYLSVQYLLNVRAIVNISPHLASRNLIDQLSKDINDLTDSSFFGCKDICDLAIFHTQEFKNPSYDNPISLPPQNTEILNAVGSLPNNLELYSQYMTILDARMFYTHWRIYTGKDHPTSSMTLQQATESVAKSVRFWRERKLNSLVKRAGLIERYHTPDEVGFRDFLGKEVDYLLQNAESKGLDVTGLAGAPAPPSKDRFPLSLYSAEHIISQHEDSSWLFTILEGIKSNAPSEILVTSLFMAIGAISRRRVQKQARDQLDYKGNDNEIAEKNMKSAILAADEGRATQDKKIGPAKLYRPKKGKSKKSKNRN